ncbi:type IV toxin-antitoxin system AbiEi family antitoxin domain-containing protein [Fusibacter ferrireducens]|uniref:Abortive infection protein AbiGI n=1 Tax=Fusibacter ferrireducens TaxID=2785058 RepID=A0ABR9ZVQ6_9FIRM|nr:hypothetical protein [Fusibacter ferrireducens]MBF4694248.1 hypothetical protein [Fusibacter ferrireducens]
MNKEITIPKDKKIYNTGDLMALGLSYYKINKLIEEEKLVKLNKSHYENLEFQGEDNDFYYVSAYAQTGVICLLSAAIYYDLTTYRPDAIDVAVPKKKNITTLPEWPIIKIYYFDKDRYDLGVNQIDIGRNQFKIYDKEKTVVDIVYYRNKIGIEETKEILTNYLKQSERNINQLIRYSKQLKCYDILSTYLEVMI